MTGSSCKKSNKKNKVIMNHLAQKGLIMLVSEISTDTFVAILQEQDWDLNSDMYRDGEDVQPDFSDEKEYPRSFFLEHFNVKEEDEASQELLDGLED